MSDPMSQSFINAFLTTCFDAGLSKEAAAELLQKESVDQALSVSQPWTEGYLSVANQVPGRLQPMLFTDGGMEKVARSGLLQAVRGLKDIIVGGGRAVGNLGRGLGRGTKAVYGPSSGSFLRRHPLTTTLGTAALAGGAGVGGYHFLNRDRGMMNPYGTSDPFFGPGGYDPAAYESRYEDKLYNDYGPGIFKNNKEYFGSKQRREELEKAVANNQGGGQAYRELQELNRQHGKITKQRDSYFRDITGARTRNNSVLDRISKRQQGLEKQRTAWWAAPKRWYLKATGQDPDQYYDRQVGQLEDAAQQAQFSNRMLKDRGRLLEAGATGRSAPKQPSRDELQEDFFPSYDTD